MNTQTGTPILRRSLLFVPGGEPRKLMKSTRAGADTLVLDLEDSVSIPQKTLARESVVEFIRGGICGDCEIAVRVNPPGTAYFEDDLEAVLDAGVQSIMLPKTVPGAHLRDLVQRIEARSGKATPRLLALVETAEGIARLPELASQSDGIDAVCFGHVDFSQDMGLAESDASHGVVHHARCALSIAAHASGVAAIDTVYVDVRNEASFRRDAIAGMNLGFSGKMCIHPRQVAIVNEVFTPSEEQIAHARRVIEGHEESQQNGIGVFALDGKMVDMPIVAAQRQVLERARRAGVLED